MEPSHEIQRLTVDFYNNTNELMLAEAEYYSVAPLLPSAKDYTAVVESASVDLSNMILNTNPDYTIMIYNDSHSPGLYPNLVDGANYFTFDGDLRYVDELVNWFYDILRKKPMPADLGNIDVNDDGNFIYNLSSLDGYNSGLEVYFNTKLKEILPEMVSAQTMTIMGVPYYKFRGPEMFGSVFTQKRNTMSRLMTAVSVRFYSNLPTTTHYIHNPQLQTIVNSNVFSSIALNAEQYDVMKKFNIIYVPTQYRHITMNNDAPVQQFKIWIKIYYKNGEHRLHTMQPGDYSYMNIAFYPRSETEQT